MAASFNGFWKSHLTALVLYAARFLLLCVLSAIDYTKWFADNGIELDSEPRFPLTEFDVVDGRMGWQWLVSVKGYLDWRSGRDWHNWRQRKQLRAESEYYSRAINFLNCEVRHFGELRAPAKKPVASARLPITHQRRQSK